MTDLSPAAREVLRAYMNNCGWLDGPLKKDYQCAAAVLRAAVEQLGYSNVPEEFTHLRPLVIDSDDLLAIAAELEGFN